MKFSNFLSAIFSIYLLIFLAACNSTNSDSDSENNNTEVLVPLQAGNTWTYEFSDSGFDREEQLTVGDARTINGEEYHEIERLSIDNEGDGEVETFFAGYKGIGLFLGQGAPFAEFPLKYPIEDGEIYTHTDEDGNDYTITATEMSLEVPAGNFSCIEYNIEVAQSGSDANIDACISPEVGLIRYGGFSGGGGFVLSSYDIGG